MEAIVVHRQLADAPLELADARADEVLPVLAASYSAFSDRSPCAAAVCELLRELEGELVLQVRQLLLEPGEDREFHALLR